MADATHTPPDATQVEPGAPIPADAIDPELMRLPPPRVDRHPLIALFVILLGGLLLFRMRADLAYALQGDAPQDLGEARGASAAAQPGRYVHLRGLPDHRNTVSFEAKGERARAQIFRLLSTGSRLLVLTGDPAERQSLRNEFTGRLRRFDELSFASSIRDHYQQKGQALRALDLADLRARPAGPLPAPYTAPDRAGEPLQLGGGDTLRITVRFPEDVRALCPKTKFPSEPDARRELARVGAPLGPGVETADGYGYVLRVPAADRARVLGELEARGLLFRQRFETYRVPLSQVRADAAGLVVPGPRELPQPVRYERDGEKPVLVPVKEAATTPLPWDEISAVQAVEPLVIAEGALVLIEGESPGSLRRWVLPLWGMLLLFLGFNLWYLFRALRAPRRAPANAS